MSRAVVMTRDLAHAAGTDAANRLMRQKGLRAWDDDCLLKAAETFHRLYACAFLKSINCGQCPECEP